MQRPVQNGEPTPKDKGNQRAKPDDGRNRDREEAEMPTCDEARFEGALERKMETALRRSQLVDCCNVKMLFCVCLPDPIPNM